MGSPGLEKLGALEVIKPDRGGDVVTTQENFCRLLAAKAGPLAVLFDDPRVVKSDRD